MKPEDLTKILLHGKFGFSFNGYVLKQSANLLRVRLWIYSAAYVHLVIVAVKLLTIDFSKVEDPSLWFYDNVKWKLITCWFNLVSTVYLPMCIYCDLKELRGEADQPLVKQLNRYRFLLYTSILLPTTTFADILFWRLWVKDRELVAPVAVDEIVPFWTQHCMHTVSLVVTLLDLVLVPRKRPRSIAPGLALMTAFLSAYFVVSFDSFMQGEYLYPVLKRFSTLKLIVLVVYVCVEHLFYYFGQFFVYDILWGRNRIENHHTL